jgi:hypothetical protein
MSWLEPSVLPHRNEFQREAGTPERIGALAHRGWCDIERRSEGLRLASPAGIRQRAPHPMGVVVPSLISQRGQRSGGPAQASLGALHWP